MEHKVWSVTLVLAITLLTTGCPTHTQSPRDESDELVGAPPSQQQDPFASQVRPPDSARAPSTGMMDVEQAERGQTPRPALVKEARPEQVPKKDVVAAPAPVKPDGVEPMEALHKCFSCVQICPASDRSGDCSQSKEDVICGWGTSSSEPDARKLARAECDATLDMAREMPRFSRIDGSCPRATCTLD